MKRSTKVLFIILPVLFVLFIGVLAYNFTRVNVTFSSGNGAFKDGKTEMTITVGKGTILEDIRFFVPQRDGYEFTGWQVEGESGKISSLYEFNRHTVLVPTWR